MKRLSVILLLIIPFISSLVAADGYSGHVVAVLDGDTIEVLHDHHAEPIRLNAIDRFEKGQWSRESG